MMATMTKLCDNADDSGDNNDQKNDNYTAIGDAPFGPGPWVQAPWSGLRGPGSCLA